MCLAKNYFWASWSYYIILWYNGFTIKLYETSSFTWKK